MSNTKPFVYDSDDESDIDASILEKKVWVDPRYNHFSNPFELNEFATVDNGSPERVMNKDEAWLTKNKQAEAELGAPDLASQPVDAYVRNKINMRIGILERQEEDLKAREGRLKKREEAMAQMESSGEKYSNLDAVLQAIETGKQIARAEMEEGATQKGQSVDTTLLLSKADIIAAVAAYVKQCGPDELAPELLAALREVSTEYAFSKLVVSSASSDIFTSTPNTPADPGDLVNSASRAHESASGLTGRQLIDSLKQSGELEHYMSPAKPTAASASEDRSSCQYSDGGMMESFVRVHEKKGLEEREGDGSSDLSNERLLGRI